MSASPSARPRYSEELVFGPGALALVLAGFVFWPMISVGPFAAFVSAAAVGAATFLGIRNSERLAGWPKPGYVVAWAGVVGAMFIAVLIVGVSTFENDIETILANEALAEEAGRRALMFFVGGYLASLVVFVVAMAVSLVRRLRPDAEAGA